MNHASIALVGTYPPTQCGLATFTRSSAMAMSQNRRVGVVELLDAPRGNAPSMVAGSWVRGDRQSMLAAVAALETFDAVVLEHEFGIYGGPDGDEVLDLARALRIPIVAVLHTVLEQPSPHQRFILEQLAQCCDAVVTLTETARRRLLRSVSIDPLKVFVIPHGAHEVRSRFSTFVSGSVSFLQMLKPTDEQADKSTLGYSSSQRVASMNWDTNNLPFANLVWPEAQKPKSKDPRVLLTWGLLGPGKGIEHVIDAVSLLRDMDRPPQYWVVGETHPKVRETSGESYRESLVQRAIEGGVEHLVKFFDGYRDLTGLHELITQADLVVLPYESREQVTSGVLVEAIAAGLPVVATDFPHARELLSQGCGVVVPHDDPIAMAAAIREILTHDSLRFRLGAVARRIAPSLYWPEVGRSFGALVDRCVAVRRKLDVEVHDRTGVNPVLVG
jgi:polysaccharide biosynthesis protein PslF